jgi:hypothetical protein
MMLEKKLEQYAKMFDDGFPMYQLGRGRTDEEIVELIDTCIKEKKDAYEINLNKENKEEDDSQTVYQSFEINEKDLDTINKFKNVKINGTDNNNNSKDNNDKSERKHGFKPNEKNKYNIYKNTENSFNDMIDYGLLGNDSIISGDIGSTNIYWNNSTINNKDSTKTESK